MGSIQRTLSLSLSKNSLSLSKNSLSHSQRTRSHSLSLSKNSLSLSKNSLSLSQRTLFLSQRTLSLSLSKNYLSKGEMLLRVKRSAQRASTRPRKRRKLSSLTGVDFLPQPALGKNLRARSPLVFFRRIFNSLTLLYSLSLQNICARMYAYMSLHLFIYLSIHISTMIVRLFEGPAFKTPSRALDHKSIPSSRLKVQVETLLQLSLCCMYVCMYICMYVSMHVCMYVCMYVCMHACMYVCMYVSMYVFMYVCMFYVCMYVCMCLCVCMCVYNKDNNNIGIT